MREGLTAGIARGEFGGMEPPEPACADPRSPCGANVNTARPAKGCEPPRDCRRFHSLSGWNDGTQFPPEVRERAVRMVFESSGRHASQWETIGSISEKIGCSSEALRKWLRQAEVGQR